MGRVASHGAPASVPCPVRPYCAPLSINDLDACYDPERTYMVAAPAGPSRISMEAVTVLFVCEYVWMVFSMKELCGVQLRLPASMIEQLGLFVACQQRGVWRCYLNGSPLHNEPFFFCSMLLG